MFIDYATRHFTDNEMEYDKYGLLGKNGKVSTETVQNSMKDHPFFTHSPPKNTSRELFGEVEAIEFIKICE